VDNIKIDHQEMGREDLAGIALAEDKQVADICE